jgi:hypothetical protein
MSEVTSAPTQIGAQTSRPDGPDCPVSCVLKSDAPHTGMKFSRARSTAPVSTRCPRPCQSPLTSPHQIAAALTRRYARTSWARRIVHASAASAMSALVVPDSDLGRTAQLVLACTGTADQFALHKGHELKLDVPGGAPSVGPSTVFQAIAQASARGQELLGSTPEASAQVRRLPRRQIPCPASAPAWSIAGCSSLCPRLPPSRRGASPPRAGGGVAHMGQHAALPPHGRQADEGARRGWRRTGHARLVSSGVPPPQLGAQMRPAHRARRR